LKTNHFKQPQIEDAIAQFSDGFTGLIFGGFLEGKHPKTVKALVNHLPSISYKRISYFAPERTSHDGELHLPSYTPLERVLAPSTLVNSWIFAWLLYPKSLIQTQLPHGEATNGSSS
jgi:hypothetical protein